MPFLKSDYGTCPIFFSVRGPGAAVFEMRVMSVSKD